MVSKSSPKSKTKQSTTEVGLTFQEKVFALLRDKFFTHPNVKIIENHKVGAIDYVVHEENSLRKKKILKHYFECKNYNTALKLDDVAKIMVVAVADQPATVHVVSRTKLQPQVLQYASRLFSVIDGDVQLPNDQTIFTGVEFWHWQSDGLLKLEPGSFGYTSESAASQAALPDTVWWLSECSAFATIEIASSTGDRADRLPVRHDATLTISVVSSEPNIVTVDVIGLPEEACASVGPDKGPLASATSPKTFLIKTDKLGPGLTPIIEIVIKTKGSEKHIAVGRLSVAHSTGYLPPLRVGQVEQFRKSIGEAGDRRLILVDGLAGAGKTHLIEKVAETLRANSGYEITRLTVTDENSDTLMESLLRACLVPSLGIATFEELAKAIQSRLRPDGELGTMVTDINLTVRHLVQQDQRIIVLRDCQYLSQVLAQQLWAFILALDDAGWGNFRLVLEYRQPEGGSNPALQDLISNINLKIRKVIDRVTVDPLNAVEFRDLTKTLFMSITDQIVDLLFKKTGGLPLFIDSYIRQLERVGHISRNKGDARFSIDRPQELMGDTSLPEQGAVLEERVRIWVRKTLGANPEQWLSWVGLIAVAEDLPSQQLVRRALDISDADVKELQRQVDQGHIGSGRPDGHIDFRHDLLRAAIISVAAADTGFAAAAIKLTETLDRQISNDNALLIMSIRIKIFALLECKVELETELWKGVKQASKASDFSRLSRFLVQLLDLTKARQSNQQRFELMSDLARVTWFSDSLPLARNRYQQLINEAEQCSTEDFAIIEYIVTDALRRMIGIDLELLEPTSFLQNAIKVLKRNQSPLTFNSIINRLVTFCARFGYPQYGHAFATLSLDYIGNGETEFEAAVLCSELGHLYAPSDPQAALTLFEQGLANVTDLADPQWVCNTLDLMILQTLYQGKKLEPSRFTNIWKESANRGFTEHLARASLLMGSIFLRESDLNNAAVWIDRSTTFVRLYHLKEFLLGTLNDQVLLALLRKDDEKAQRYFAELVSELDRILAQHPFESLLDEALAACKRALPDQKSPTTLIPLPEEAPRFCNPLGELSANIIAFSKKLGHAEVAARYRDSNWISVLGQTHRSRQIEIEDQLFVLGAY